MWFLTNDGNGWTWDEDQGMKTPCSPACWVSSYHIRVYAVNPPDYNYNVYWGYYVLGTSHRDRSEACPSGQQYGWSEEAEVGGLGVAYNTLGWSVASDWTFGYNYQNPAWFRNHYYAANGYLSRIVVP